MGWRFRTPAESGRPGPFGLHGFFLFVLAAAVYLSMLASIAALFKGGTPNPWARLLVALFVVLAWAVLLPIQRYWGVTIAVRVHWVGPAAMLLLMLVPLLLAQVGLALTGVALACAASSLVSVPIAVATRLATARGRFQGPTRPGS